MVPKEKVAGLGLVLLTAGLLLHSSPSRAATVTFNLCADEGSIPLPDPTTFPAPANVPIWGFALNPGAGCGAASVPGPVLTVNQGDVVNVNLTNNLNNPLDAVSILFPGQALRPDTVGAAGAGGSTSYSFTASAPGTYLYTAGMNPDVQVPMGLYGALVVRPAGFPSRAYAGSNTAFGTQAVLVLSDMDPRLNANPHGFNLANYNPTYWLINGKAYPDTAPITVAPGQVLLLRYVNAGSTNTALTVVGLRQTLIAKDAFVQPFINSVASETIAAGQTTDTLVTGPTRPGRYPLYNRQMHITNGAPNLTPPIPASVDRGVAAPHFPGGMMTFITVPNRLIFSTGAEVAIPGVLTPFDNSDVYSWNGVSAYARLLDATGIGLPNANTNVDGLVMVDYNTFYFSFADTTTTVPILGAVPDEDIVKYDAGTWSLFFDGSAVGLGTSDGEDVDAFDILSDGSVVVSTRGSTVVPLTVGTLSAVAQDVLMCVPTTLPGVPITGCTWSMYFDGSDVGLETINTTENIDGVSVAATRIYLSTGGTFAVAGLSGEGKDVFACNNPGTGPTTTCSSFSMFFDGSARGLASTVTIDAIDVP